MTYATPHEIHRESDAARFGYIVSKSVGNAVTRNLVRRRMKSITESLLHQGFSGSDIVFRALPASAAAPYPELEAEVLRGIDRALRSSASGAVSGAVSGMSASKTHPSRSPEQIRGLT